MKACRKTSQFSVQVRAVYMSMCSTFFLIICCPPTLSGDILTCTNFCGRICFKRSSHKYCFKALSQTCDVKICHPHIPPLLTNFYARSHRLSLSHQMEWQVMLKDHHHVAFMFERLSRENFPPHGFWGNFVMRDCKSTRVFRGFRKFEIFRVQWIT